MQQQDREQRPLPGAGEADELPRLHHLERSQDPEVRRGHLPPTVPHDVTHALRARNGRRAECSSTPPPVAREPKRSHAHVPAVHALGRHRRDRALARATPAVARQADMPVRPNGRPSSSTAGSGPSRAPTASASVPPPSPPPPPPRGAHAAAARLRRRRLAADHDRLVHPASPCCWPWQSLAASTTGRTPSAPVRSERAARCLQATEPGAAPDTELGRVEDVGTSVPTSLGTSTACVALQPAGAPFLELQRSLPVVPHTRLRIAMAGSRHQASTAASAPSTAALVSAGNHALPDLWRARATGSPDTRARDELQASAGDDLIGLLIE